MKRFVALICAVLLGGLAGCGTLVALPKTVVTPSTAEVERVEHYQPPIPREAVTDITIQIVTPGEE